MTANDIPFKHEESAFAGDAAGIELEALLGLAAGDIDHARLGLPLPDMLPVEVRLGEAERAVLREALTALLRALELSDHAESLKQLDALFARLGEGSCEEPARIGETGIPAGAAQVDDFDSYFRVSRIASPQPALVLVRGLVQTARAVTSLFARAPDLPEARMRQQIAGFITYAHVLARTFDLGELS